MQTHTERRSARIAQVRTDEAGCLAAIGRAAALGFDHILFTHPAGVAVEAELIAAAQAHGLRGIVDLPVTRVPLSLRRDATAQRLFCPVPAPTLDPRRPAHEADVAVAAVGEAEEAEALGEWWADHIATLLSSGASGVRLLGLAELPGGLLPPFLTRLRKGSPDAVLFGWTPGLAWDTLSAIPPGLLDLVAASLPWWDGRSDWLWREIGLLRRIGSVVMSAEADLPWATSLAVTLGDGWMVPVSEGSGDQLQQTNAMLERLGHGPAVAVSAPGQPVMALVRTDASDARQASRATLTLINTDPQQPATLDPASILPRLGRDFGTFEAVQGGSVLDPLRPLTIAPGAALHFVAKAPAALAVRKLVPDTAIHAAAAPRLAIEAPTPCVDAGRFPARRVVGSVVEVQADVIGDGHDKLAAMLRWQEPGSDAWHETPMRPLGNDRWTASFPLHKLGTHAYTVCAWRDAFAAYADELSKKFAAGVPIRLELTEGQELVASTAAQAGAALQSQFKTLLKTLSLPDEDVRRTALLDPATARLMAQADPRPFLVTLDPPVPVQAERSGAGFASWYEVFPRSLSDDETRHGTFADVERHLPRIRDMGFDVLYFPPIHPIGRVNRKGRNNTLTPSPDDPGSPYAIGSADGGHDALHPELGTLEDFQRLRAACAEHGLELAMDFAIQCSPDHPWLKQHKDWFTWRPDGTIRYAENPPKKYEDIVNVDFYAPGAVPGLWVALCEAVLHWAGQGVRLFRVDNPHTKPLPFWEWMIAEVQARYPDTVFLAEAFTRPKVMYRLAKVGFSQSYTYFTWRETKAEFQEYLTELTQGPARDFFRPHFFVNTPDINPVYLQGASRGAYLVRAALAATLSGLWGVYNGFELCEGTPMPGKEEYLDSEKYQLRAWDWDRPGNIVPEITALNAIRKLNPALHSHLGVTFLPASGDQVLWFEKATPDRANVLLVAINMDPSATQAADLGVPFHRFTPEPATLAVTDLLSGQASQWRDRTLRISLPPDRPYAVWRIEPLT